MTAWRRAGYLFRLLPGVYAVGQRSWAPTVRDRRRELVLRAAMYTPLRYVWDQLIGEPALVERELRSALRAP